jgi:hypothetical protein
MATSPSHRRVLATDIIRTLLLVLGLLAVTELGFRAVVPALSKNSRTLAAHAERAERIAQASEPSILILGNSVSGDGIDAEMLATAWAAQGFVAQIEHQPADSSAMVDWFYQLKNQFVAVNAVPDVVVIPVGNPYPLTRINPQTEDLLYSFLTWDDLPAYLARAEVVDFESRAAVYAGKLSALYAFRGRLQKRVLSTLLPGFPTLRGAMLDARAPAEARVTPVWAEALAALAAEHGIQVIIVAMPTAPLEARLPDATREVCARLGWTTVEAGQGFTLTPEELPDGLHLEPEAARRWTQHLAPRLLEAIELEGAR